MDFKSKIAHLIQLIVIGCLTYFIHELAHYYAHLSLGHTVDFKINRMDLIDPTKISSGWKQGWVAGSGVLITFLQGSVAYVLLIKRPLMLWFNILLSSFTLRFAAALLGLVKSSDEIKTSIALGLPPYGLTIVLLGLLMYFVLRAQKQMGIKTTTVFIHFILLFGTTYLFSLLEF
ncbi:MAG: hypothetical protein ACPH63_06975 [Flavobacteriaceae bacterium]